MKISLKNVFHLAWTTDNSQKIIVAYSPESTFQVRLPPGDNQTSLLNIAIHVRDTLDCVTVVNMTRIPVMTDQREINDLLNLANLSNNNPIVQLLWSGNQNIVAQIVNSISQTINQMNIESIDKAISSKYFTIKNSSEIKSISSFFR